MKSKSKNQKISFLVSSYLFCISDLIFYVELKKNLVLLEKASKDKDFKMAGTLTKNLKKLRKMYDLPDAVLALSFYLPDLFIRLMLPTQPTPLKEGVKIEEMLHCTQARVDEIMITAEA